MMPSRVTPGLVAWQAYGVTVYANLDSGTVTVEGASGMGLAAAGWLHEAIWAATAWIALRGRLAQDASRRRRPR